MVELKSAGEIAAMREAGRVVADVLATVRKQASVGDSLAELDEVAWSVIKAAGGTSLFHGYQPHFARAPFAGAICTSVNDAVLHGPPGPARLADGDLVSIDCGVAIDGWAADAATSFVVGTARPEDLALIEATERAVDAGIAAAQPGARIGDIGHAIGEARRAAGVGTSLDFGGHGIGRRMHEDPHIPNDGRPGKGFAIRPGLVMAIEPWFWHGTHDRYVIDDDGWTLRSADGSRGAHAEHTVAVTADGPVVLTVP